MFSYVIDDLHQVLYQTKVVQLLVLVLIVHKKFLLNKIHVHYYKLVHELLYYYQIKLNKDKIKVKFKIAKKENVRVINE